MTEPLDQLTPMSEDLERQLRALYPSVAASLDRNFRIDWCGNLVGWRVMQHGRPESAEYFNTELEAREARRARIMHLLMMWHNWQTSKPHAD